MPLEGRSGLAWRGPLARALIGRRRGQQRGRHAPSPGAADKACQGGTRLAAQKICRVSQPRQKTATEARAPLYTFLLWGRRNFPAAEPASQLNLQTKKPAQLIAALTAYGSLPLCALQQGNAWEGKGGPLVRRGWGVAFSRFFPPGPRIGNCARVTDPLSPLPLTPPQDDPSFLVCASCPSDPRDGAALPGYLGRRSDLRRIRSAQPHSLAGELRRDGRGRLPRVLKEAPCATRRAQPPQE